MNNPYLDNETSQPLTDEGDIKWRELNDETYALLKQNPNREVLVRTSVSIRFSWAKYIDNLGRNRLSKEDVLELAFFEK